MTRQVVDLLAEQHPNADTELHHRNAFELLAATILSAQSTDQRVNMVTPALFARYPDAHALAAADSAALERAIVSTGFFRQKAKALIGMARQLVARHDGAVPADMALLTELPGVGRKTANVVLGHALGVPGLPVDRHVLRVANRIGIADGDDPERVETQLCERLEPAVWTLTSDVLILHGRRVCRPKPACDRCAVRDLCDYYRHVVLPESADPRAAGGPVTKKTRKTRKTTTAATAPATTRTPKRPKAPPAPRGTAGANTTSKARTTRTAHTTRPAGTASTGKAGNARTSAPSPAARRPSGRTRR